MQLDTMELHTERQLRRWADEIRGGCENLGFASENWLHKALGRSIAVRHIGISELTLIAETIVCEIEKENHEAACALKGYYLARGVGTEKRKRLAEKLLGRELTRYKFWQLFRDGFDRAKTYYDFLAKTD